MAVSRDVWEEALYAEQRPRSPQKQTSGQHHAECHHSLMVVIYRMMVRF
jgi:hypothetical protein